MRLFTISAVLVMSSILVSSSLVAPTFASTTAKEWQETRSWDASFTQHQTKGVVVLWNENKQQGFTNNLKRANQGFYLHRRLRFLTV